MKDKILAMTAGRELDKKIATEIFGASTITKPSRLSEKTFHALVSGEKEGFQPLEKGKTLKNVWWRHTVDEAWDACPSYSTDISAAWEVVKKMKLTHFVRVTLEEDSSNCMIRDYGDRRNHIYDVTGESINEAICKAALLAVMDS